MAGAARRLERDRLFSEIDAWQTARLVMIGMHAPRKFPEFARISSVRRKRKRQHWREQKAVVLMMNAALGGKVR